MLRSAASYTRVSSKAQGEADRFGLAVQDKLIREYAGRHGFRIDATFEDQITGTSATREHLSRLLDAAPRFEAVIISSIDRLGRRVGTCYGVLGELIDAGLEVHSSDIGLIDPDSENGALSFGLSAIIADNDHRKLVKKLARARVAKVAGSPLTGRPGEPANPLNGYGWRQGVRDDVEAAWLIHIYTRFQHVGAHALATELDALGVRTRKDKLWTASTLRDLVRNPMYKGEYQYGRRKRGKGLVKAVCEVPALVSPELWEAVNHRLDQRNARAGTSNPLRAAMYPLSGHLRCGQCGRVMRGLSLGGRKYGYYACRSVGSTAYDGGRPCPHHRHYPPAQLHALVMQALDEVETDDAALLSLARVPERAAPDHGPALAEIKRREDKLEAAYMADAYTAAEYAERRADLRRQRDAVLNAPVPAPPPGPDLDALRARVAQARGRPLAELADLLGLTVRVSMNGGVALELDPPVGL